MKQTLFIISLLISGALSAQPTIWGGAKMKLEQGDTIFITTAGAFKNWLGLSGGGTVSSFSSGNLSPLFTTSVSNPTTTPALSFSLSNAGANTYLGNNTGSSAAPSYTSAGALTKVDDTNVTLTLGGDHAVSLLKAASITAGWTGQLSVSRGGTGASTLTGLLQGNGTSAITAISNSSTVGQVLRVTGTNTYAWGALDLADGDATTGTLGVSSGGTGLSSIGGDPTILGSNGTANVYFTPAITTTAAAIAWSRSSNTLNLNIPDADASNRGTVSTGAQTFAGAKTFSGAVTVQGLSTASAGIEATATSSKAATYLNGVYGSDHRTVTTTTTLSETDNRLYVGTLSADITINLPACNSTRDGWEFTVVKKGTDAFAFIIDPNAAETFFDGAATKFFYGQGNGVTCKCDSGATAWNVVR